MEGGPVESRSDYTEEVKEPKLLVVSKACRAWQSFVLAASSSVVFAPVTSPAGPSGHRLYTTPLDLTVLSQISLPLTQSGRFYNSISPRPILRLGPRSNESITTSFKLVHLLSSRKFPFDHFYEGRNVETMLTNIISSCLL